MDRFHPETAGDMSSSLVDPSLPLAEESLVPEGDQVFNNGDKQHGDLVVGGEEEERTSLTSGEGSSRGVSPFPGQVGGIKICQNIT